MSFSATPTRKIFHHAIPRAFHHRARLVDQPRRREILERVYQVTRRWATGGAGTQHPISLLRTRFDRVVRLGSRALLLLHGPDAARFLQGAITTNVEPLSAAKPFKTQDPFFSAFLNPQGRVLYDVFIYPFLGADPFQSGKDIRGEDLGFLIDVDAQGAEPLRKWIAKYRLRSSFSVSVRPDWQVWQSWNSRDANFQEKLAPHKNSSMFCRDPRSDGMGYRVAVPGEGAPSNPTVASGDESDYLVHRYLRGVAEGVQEIIPGISLPLESNLDLMSAIDFRKGCYLGQELTIRTKHSGVVRKRILPLIFGKQAHRRSSTSARSIEPVYDAKEAVLLPAVGSDLLRTGSDIRNKKGGKFLGGMGNVGLGLCRLDVLGELPPGDQPNLVDESGAELRAWRPDILSVH